MIVFIAQVNTGRDCIRRRDSSCRRRRVIKFFVAFVALLLLVFIARALVSNIPVGEKVAVIDINGAISKVGQGH